MCEEFGLVVDKKICNHSLKNIKLDLSEIIAPKKEKDKIDILKSLENKIIFGDEVSINLCNNSNTKICISFPFPGKTQVATHLPFMGEKGADYIIEIIREYFSSIR